MTNSRPNKKSPLIWRRRLCSKCQKTFTTYERPSLDEARIVSDIKGANETFNLGHLIQSIAMSFSHNDTAAKNDSLALAQTIESALLRSHNSLTKQLISQTTYQTLQRFDQLAAVQYGAKHQLITEIRRRGRPSLTKPTSSEA